MYAPQFAYAGFGVGSLGLTAFTVGRWPWLVLAAWILVGIVIVTIATVRFLVNDRRFKHERLIAAAQVIPKA